LPWIRSHSRSNRHNTYGEHIKCSEGQHLFILLKTFLGWTSHQNLWRLLCFPSMPDIIKKHRYYAYWGKMSLYTGNNKRWIHHTTRRCSRNLVWWSEIVLKMRSRKFGLNWILKSQEWLSSREKMGTKTRKDSCPDDVAKRTKRMDTLDMIVK